MSATPLALAALGFAAWAVYLGGLASLQANCDTEDPATWALTNGLVCSKTYRLYWFYMSWEIFILVALGAVAASGKLANLRASMVGLFAVGTLLFIEASDTFLTAESGAYWEVDSSNKNRLRTITAGSIMVAVVNAAAVLLLGLDEKTEQPAADKAAPVV